MRADNIQPAAPSLFSGQGHALTNVVFYVAFYLMKILKKTLDHNFK